MRASDPPPPFDAALDNRSGDRAGVTAKRRHVDLHEGTERQGLQKLVQLGPVFDIEDADILPLADDAPQMPPFALALQLGRAAMLLLLQFPDFAGVGVVRNRTVMVT